jgi:hypothetical protein
MNNDLNVLGGIALSGLGLYITVIQIKKINSGRAGQLGSSYQLLAGGIIFIMSGIALILKYA